MYVSVCGCGCVCVCLPQWAYLKKNPEELVFQSESNKKMSVFACVCVSVCVHERVRVSVCVYMGWVAWIACMRVPGTLLTASIT